MRLPIVDRPDDARSPGRARLAAVRPAVSARGSAGLPRTRPTRSRARLIGPDLACAGLGAVGPGAERGAPAPRLTRRGLATVIATLVIVAVLIGSAAQTATADRGQPARPGVPTGRADVVVHDGDTLWGIAVRIAPDRDPRDEVTDLIRWNGLSGPGLMPGQTLHTR